MTQKKENAKKVTIKIDDNGNPTAEINYPTLPTEFKTFELWHWRDRDAMVLELADLEYPGNAEIIYDFDENYGLAKTEIEKAVTQEVEWRQTRDSAHSREFFQDVHADRPDENLQALIAKWILSHIDEFGEFHYYTDENESRVVFDTEIKEAVDYLSKNKESTYIFDRDDFRAGVYHLGGRAASHREIAATIISHISRFSEFRYYLSHSERPAWDGEEPIAIGNNYFEIKKAADYLSQPAKSRIDNKQVL